MVGELCVMGGVTVVGAGRRSTMLRFWNITKMVEVAAALRMVLAAMKSVT